ncbi:hypothetical protein GOV10_04060 [Candidatus Woesearchaeota archaeon]|nr:hypothetical protein [Candidatus Woesearchaeota archaeon]
MEFVQRKSNLRVSIANDHASDGRTYRVAFVAVSKKILKQGLFWKEWVRRMAKKSSLRKHEILGLIYQFIGATSLGFGIYFSLVLAIRPMLYNSVAHGAAGNEWLLFPLFFGLGGLLWTLGGIEIKEALPGHKR